MTPIADTNVLTDTEPRERHVVARALLAKHVAAVSAVMFAVEGGEGGTTSHAHFAVDPLGCGEGFDQCSGCDCVGIEWREIKF